MKVISQSYVALQQCLILTTNYLMQGTKLTPSSSVNRFFSTFLMVQHRRFLIAFILFFLFAFFCIII